MIETPVWASPAMMARSIGAEPRQRGSSEGCTLSGSYSLSRGSLMSAPKAHTTSASGPTAAISSRAEGSLTFSGCSSGDLERPRSIGDRRRCQAATSTSGAVGAGEHEHRREPGAGQAFEHMGGELGGPEKGRSAGAALRLRA